MSYTQKQETANFQEPALIAALKVVIDVGLLAKWKASGSGPKTVSELAVMSRVEETLLGG